METYRICSKCSKNKQLLTEFSKSKPHKGGYYSQCKSCVNEKKRKRTHGNGNKTYISSSGRLNPLASIDSYHIDQCDACGIDFSPRGPTYKKCKNCSFIACKIVYKSLVRYVVTNETVTKITSKYIKQNTCEYCNREFTENNPRQFDHILPRVLGGNNDASNINICCKECNLSKAGLSLESWINLCKLVISTYESKSYGKEAMDHSD